MIPAVWKNLVVLLIGLIGLASMLEGAKRIIKAKRSEEANAPSADKDESPKEGVQS